MVAQGALLLWIVVAIVLFGMTTPLRAFLLTYVVGMLFLPVELNDGDMHQGVIYVTQSLQIDKFTACNIGALAGTLMFGSSILSRYRFHWIDAAYAALLAGLIISSSATGNAKDGMSNAFDNIRTWGIFLFLSRIYLTNIRELYEAMRAVVGGGFVYAGVCLIEWRLSPILHQEIYGYMQHSFGQMVRFGNFRAIGFLRHSIEVSTFMAITTTLACWLWYKGRLQNLWGMVPGWCVVGSMAVGLLATFSFSGYLAFAMCIALLAVFTMTRSRWVLVILPTAAIVWMGARYTQSVPTSAVLNAVGFVNKERVESLGFRLSAEDINIQMAHGDALFGRGPGQGAERNAAGGFAIALDAWWLVTLLFYGLYGIVTWYLIWCAGLAVTFMRWNRLTPDIQMLAVVISLMVGAELMDFLVNSFPSPMLMMLNVGLVSVVVRFQPAAAARRVMMNPVGVPARAEGAGVVA